MMTMCPQRQWHALAIAITPTTMPKGNNDVRSITWWHVLAITLALTLFRWRLITLILILTTRHPCPCPCPCPLNNNNDIPLWSPSPSPWQWRAFTLALSLSMTTTIYPCHHPHPLDNARMMTCPLPLSLDNDDTCPCHHPLPGNNALSAAPSPSWQWWHTLAISLTPALSLKMALKDDGNDMPSSSLSPSLLPSPGVPSPSCPVMTWQWHDDDVVRMRTMHPRPLPDGNTMMRATPPTWFLPGTGAGTVPNTPGYPCSQVVIVAFELLLLLNCTFTHLVGLPFLDDFTSYMTWHLHRIYIALVHSLTLLPWHNSESYPTWPEWSNVFIFWSDLYGESCAPTWKSCTLMWKK